MSAVAWTITNPGGSGTSLLAELGLSAPSVNFRIMAVSTARMVSHRDYDAETDWWEPDELVTIYRDAQPFFTGRVKECPASADDSSEARPLVLEDAWLDLEEVIYQEEWAIGAGSILYPRCILGRDALGADITTGAQIEAVIDYAISQGVDMAKGAIDAGMQLWPSEARNMSCASVITEQLRFHPDWACYLDHTTSPPTFHARAKSGLDQVTIDISDEGVESFAFAEVVRNVPRGVRIVYESAATIDGEVFRNAYIDTAGDPTGRKVMQVMLDLEGMDMQIQKSRIKVRDIPEEGNTEPDFVLQKEFLLANFPQLAEVPLAAWGVQNFQTSLVADPGGHPDPISENNPRLVPETLAEVPRQLVNGQIEDWMRKKVGQVLVSYDFLINPAAGAEDRKKIANLEGEDMKFTITATNAITKIYKGVSSYTAGEGRPVGLAATLFAAATEQQHEGEVTTAGEDVPAGRYHGKKIRLMDGAAEVMPPTVIHSATFGIEEGSMSLSFGPLPYLTAGDFLELQRLFNRRQPTWMSPAERTSNELGAEAKPGAKGDTVSGYDLPQTIVSPGGAATETPYPVRLHVTSGESETYSVSVGWGYVRERIPGAGDAVAYHEAENMWDEGDSSALATFPITIGQAVYIRAEVNADGKIAPPEEGEPAVSIVVAADNETSTHYQPKVDDGTPDGAVGFFLYKLAVLVAPVSPETTPKLKKFLTGSHLDHYAELPSILSTLDASDGVGVVTKEWDNAARCYKLRAISKGFGKNTITTLTDEIEVRGTKKAANVAIWRGDPSTRPSPEIEWEDGYMSTGNEIVGDEAEPPDPAEIDIKIPTVEAWADPDAQIQVENIAANGGYRYEVRGNEKDGSLTYTIGSGSPVTVLEWKDGLVITEDIQNISIPEVPEMELVELEICVEGEMYTREFYCKPIPPP